MCGGVPCPCIIPLGPAFLAPVVVAALWPLWPAFLALFGSSSLFFLRRARAPPPGIDMGTDGAQFPEPDIEAGPKGPPPEPPAAMEAPVEPQLSEPAQMVASQPTTFDVPPDHGPVASVPPEEAFDPQEQADMVSHMNNLLRDSPVLASGPMNPLGNDVFSKAAGGELLGSLLATSDPDALDLRALNTAPADGTPFTPEAQLENHTLLVNAAASVGAAVPQIHETQLLYAPQHKQVALQQAYNIIKHGLLSKVNAATVPFLAQLLEPGEKAAQVPPEALLSRWVNKNVEDYLMQHPQDRRRLPTDHVVSEALDGDVTTQLAMALHQVAKEPLLSVGNVILPTVPIAPGALGGEPVAGGAWGSSAIGGKDLLLNSGVDGGGAAAEPPHEARGEMGEMDELNARLDHHTNDPALARSTAGLPTTPFVPQPAAGAPAGGTTMPLQQAIMPTTVHMPLASANAGEGLPETFWRAGPEARAKQVIDHAIAGAGPKVFAVAPSDLAKPRPRMQQCFVASVVDAFGDGGEDGELDTYEDETNDSAEARVFKNWAASLGLKLNMKDLFSDSCSGIVLLKVMERLQPGSVDWGRVEGTPKNKYERVANCNYATKVAKDLGCKLVGISGQDIADGNEKLLLAIWWQLMRKDFMQFLDELDMDQAHVLTWANAQVAKSGTDIQLGRFGDKAIRSGVYLLQLMRAVAPHAVDEAHIKPGLTELERQLNAKLAISTAHKMGARVFCGWQDILEARPKLMLSMVAAVMSVYLKTNSYTKDDVLREMRQGSVALGSMRASQRGSPRGEAPAGASSRAGAMAAASTWARPHQLVEAARGSLEADNLEAPQISKARQIRERAQVAGVQAGRVMQAPEESGIERATNSFATKVRRARALSAKTRAEPALEPAMATISVANFAPVAPPPGLPPLPTARGGAPHKPDELPATPERGSSVYSPRFAV